MIEFFNGIVDLMVSVSLVFLGVFLLLLDLGEEPSFLRLIGNLFRSLFP